MMSSSRVDVECDAKETELQRPAEKVRNWKVFPGKNTFFCDGRCICAPHWYGFPCCLIIHIVMGVIDLSMALGVVIGAGGALFFTFDCRYLAVKVSPVIPVVGGILFLYILGPLCAVSLSDPGIIPRATSDEAKHNEKILSQEKLKKQNQDMNLEETEQSMQYKEIVLQGRTFRLKYCRTCHIFRPPRSTHCRHCDNCVERFDHHCPMVGNCIGKRNYRHFYLFLCSVFVFAGYVLGCNVTVLNLKAKDTNSGDAFKDSVATVIEMVVAAAAILIVGGFLGFHSYLIAMEMTTNEYLKGTYSAQKHENSTNPYRHKICCLNFFRILCSAKLPSLIDRIGYTH